MKQNRTKDIRSLQWDDLKIFLAISREGSLIAAARAMGLTQPTMGRRLQSLEKLVGCKLLRRTSSGYILTEDGMAVLSHAERMEEEALAFERQLAAHDGEVNGTLRVSALDWLASHVLAPVIARLQQQHSRMVVELSMDPRLLSLDRRETDLVFCFNRFEEAYVVQRRLTHVHYGVYASRAYLEQRGKPHPSTGGVGHDLITMDSARSHQADVVWLTGRLPKARIIGRSSSRHVQARMCAEGGGLAVLPLQVAESTPGLEQVDLGEPPPDQDVWLGYHRDFQHHRRLRVLLDAVEAALMLEHPKGMKRTFPPRAP
ncbi:LysR family transcriptional regulator [Cystobacter fuscus]|uniref:LysR family transcriptional regulator n=1 Tax=Cystobacter fuscus TaxID=43 RepID=A0A250JH40_9BACT|nr:LysR family transcriptional regulator [Cystobacter fuscus]ATB43195.1 LysR family transcriptional regulator [Cystobacter fuscus]